MANDIPGLCEYGLLKKLVMSFAFSRAVALSIYPRKEGGAEIARERESGFSEKSRGVRVSRGSLLTKFLREFRRAASRDIREGRMHEEK